MVYYSRTHQWVRLEAESVTVGITQHAADALEDILHINLPDVGFEVKQAGVLCDIEAVKAASDVHAPLSGTVLEVNTALSANPELLNSAPEAEGWICRMAAPDAKTEISRLMGAEDYAQYRKNLPG